MAKNKRKKGKGKKRGGVPRTDLSKRTKSNVIPLAAGPVLEVTDGSFDQVIGDSQVPVLVDFWAPWCGPCKAIGPVVEELAKERKGELLVVKYNTEANSRVAGELGVRSIPTLALFRDGEVADVKVGAVNKAGLVKWIDKTLGHEKEPGLLGRLFG